MTNAIELNHISKSFGEFSLKNVTLAIPAGTICGLVGENGVSMIQWRNLNIDPEWYLGLMRGIDHGPIMGLSLFMKRLKKLCPWLRFGYFNPYVGEKAELTAPLPGQWQMPDLSVADAPLAGPASEEAAGEADAEAGA